MTWHIAVDGRALAEGLGGFKRYAENLLPAMCAVDPRLRVHLLSHQPLASHWSEEPFSTKVIRGTMSLPTRLLWERRISHHVPNRAQAFFSPMSLALRTHLPTAITVHDTAFRTHPTLLPRRYRWYWRHLAKRWPNADLVLVPSQITRAGVSQLGVSADKITVTGEGVAGELQPTPAHSVETPTSLKPFMNILQGKFVLFVGTIEPRKNLATLVAAMRRTRGAPPTPLVLAGRRGWGAVPEGLPRRPPNRAEASGLQSSVLELGPVSDNELSYLYSQATVLALPSWTEGFGLPALEALCAGLPVVASDRGALPEVLGNAGLLLPPGDTALWATTLDALLRDPARRRKMVKRGLDRATHFSWQATARTSLAALRDLVD